MMIYQNELTIHLEANCDIKDITSIVEDELIKSGIKKGLVSLFIPGSTGSITTIEYEPGVISDLKRAINRLIPSNIPYDHDRAWHDGNGHSHVQAALLGPSLTIPVKNGRLVLGTWQQIVVINHDVRTRNRRIFVTIMGE